jgi:hypothetical protein
VGRHFKSPRRGMRRTRYYRRSAQVSYCSAERYTEP